MGDERERLHGRTRPLGIGDVVEVERVLCLYLAANVAIAAMNAGTLGLAESIGPRLRMLRINGVGQVIGPSFVEGDARSSLRKRAASPILLAASRISSNRRVSWPSGIGREPSISATRP